MHTQKFILPSVIGLSVVTGIALLALSERTKSDQPAMSTPSSLEMAGPHSLNLSNGAIVSCAANAPGQAVSFISQGTDQGDKKTVIISEDKGQKTVAVIVVNADRLLYGHWPDPIEHTSPMVAKGIYDANRKIYKAKYLGPGDVVPTVGDWQENLALAKTICGGNVPDLIHVTLRSTTVGAYDASQLNRIDFELAKLLSTKSAVDRHGVESDLGLTGYGISVFQPG